MCVIPAHELGHLADEVPDLLEFGTRGLPHGLANLRGGYLEEVCAFLLWHDPGEGEDFVGENPGPPGL